MGSFIKETGPGLWKILHSIQTHSDLKILSEIYKNIIPCEKCRKHFGEHLISHPIPHDDIFEWTFHLHNKVNERNGKKIFTLEEAKKKTALPPDYLEHRGIWFLLYKIAILSDENSIEDAPSKLKNILKIITEDFLKIGKFPETSSSSFNWVVNSFNKHNIFGEKTDKEIAWSEYYNEKECESCKVI